MLAGQVSKVSNETVMVLERLKVKAFIYLNLCVHARRIGMLPCDCMLYSYRLVDRATRVYSDHAL